MGKSRKKKLIEKRKEEIDDGKKQRTRCMHTSLIYTKWQSNREEGEISEKRDKEARKY